MNKILSLFAVAMMLMSCASAPKSDEEKAAEERKLREHSQEMQGDLDKASSNK